MASRQETFEQKQNKFTTQFSRQSSSRRCVSEFESSSSTILSLPGSDEGCWVVGEDSIRNLNSVYFLSTSTEREFFDTQPSDG